MRPPDALPDPADISAILRTLRKHRVRYILVGGLAGMAHGSAYPTFDVDIAYDRAEANLQRLATALGEMGARLRGAPRNLPFTPDAETLSRGLNFTFDTRFGPFDILGELRGVGTYERVAKAALATTIEGVEVDVISLDHLIAMKSAAGRDKDKLMVAEYIALADEHRRMRTDGDSNG